MTFNNLVNNFIQKIIVRKTQIFLLFRGVAGANRVFASSNLPIIPYKRVLKINKEALNYIQRGLVLPRAINTLAAPLLPIHTKTLLPHMPFICSILSTSWDGDSFVMSIIIYDAIQYQFQMRKKYKMKKKLEK